MFEAMKKLIYLLIVLSFISCDVMKQSTKSKEDLSSKESFEQITFRPGDSVSFRPKPNIIYKDTTIYRVTKNNTRLETVYDSNGNIRDINCYTDKIEELTKRNSELEYQNKEKEKTKTEEFDSSFILYIIGAVVILGMFGFTLIFLLLRKNTKAIELIAGKIT
jgi:hypothetical protein